VSDCIRHASLEIRGDRTSVEYPTSGKVRGAIANPPTREGASAPQYRSRSKTPDEKLPPVVRRDHGPINGAILSKNLALGNAKIVEKGHDEFSGTAGSAVAT
jgi:hypothetical protein